MDIKKDRADVAAKKYGCKAYYDFETMLKEDKPDCIHICTPHYLHVPMAVTALRKGIHVLCEKPCAISEEGLELLRKAQENSTANFGVCFQNRYIESVATIKDMIEKKILSKNSTITFGGGEPTILQEFEELVYLLLDYDVYNIRIHSDGIKYSPAIEKVLKLGKITLTAKYQNIEYTKEISIIPLW